MAQPVEIKTYDILGVGVDAISQAHAIHYVTDWASAKGRPSGYIVKPYVEFFDRAYRDSATQQLLNQASLSIPDSIAVQWAGWYLYGGHHSLLRLVRTLIDIIRKPERLTGIFPDRAAGINFTWPLLEACARKQLRVYLIGHPKTGTIERTAQIVSQAIPGLTICGCFDGYEINSNFETAMSELKAAKPDVILVGMGFPRQEQIMSRLVSHITHGVFIGEGGTFDYERFGGTFRKAPTWMQRAGLEWLWRLRLEPSRIGRQLAIPRFIWRVYRAGQTK